MVTHLCSGLVGHALAPARLRPWAPLFVLGAVLPDLAARAPALVVHSIHDHLMELPPLLLYCWNPLHLPAGVLLICFMLTLLFPEHQRRPALTALLTGAALHVVLDLCQRHVGLGYPLLIPFSSRDFELGLMGSEATVGWAPFLALATGLLWLPRLLKKWRPASLPVTSKREKEEPSQGGRPSTEPH
jgi:membrane-bound metal-dependent hydrolase YbcI (DUF457 family)